MSSVVRTDAVAAWWDGVPAEHRGRLAQLDRLISEVADEHDATPLVVELKWGQPSYRSPHGNESTPIRLGWTDDGDVAMMTHCQSKVIPEFREAHGDSFRIDANRAVLIGHGDEIGERREAALAELIRHALTYRRR